MVYGQSDTMYVMKNGVVTHAISTETEIDSVVFYRPAIMESIVDADGNVYSSVVIGSQEWLSENLRTSKFSNGESIPEITDNSVWQSFNTPAFCWYDNSDIHDVPNGKLYNWFTVNDSRNICPIGWHVPSNTEWQTLINYVSSNGYSGTEGVALKSINGWANSGNGTNAFGFNGLPVGFRADLGDFAYLNEFGCYWSTTAVGGIGTYYHLYSGFDYVDSNNWNNHNGLSIRCLKN